MKQEGVYLLGLCIVSLFYPVAWILDWILEPPSLVEKRTYEIFQESISCFFCLESMKDMIYLRQFNHCQCKIRVHNHCWNQWKLSVTPLSCPLCRQNNG